MKKDIILSENRKYRIDPDYILRTVGGRSIIIPTGGSKTIENALLMPDDTGLFLWQQFILPCTIGEAVRNSEQAYRGSRAVIAADVMRFVREMIRYGIMREAE